MKSNVRPVLELRKSKKGVEYPVYEPIGEKFTKPSLTVPDMNIPLKTLIQRYRRDGTEFLEGIYEGDDSIVPPNFERMDKLQRLEFMKANAQQIMEKRWKLHQKEQEQREKEKQDAFEAEVQKRLSEVKADAKLKSAEGKSDAGA